MADPASPAPVPSPDTPPRSGSGPKRIRSLPDRPASLRPAGGIRSVPGRTPVSTRLPGTDAASYGGDMSWRRGITILWTLFILIAAGEAFVLAIYLLAGGFHWPKVGDALRLTALCGVFLALWFGWTWTRWVLAVIAFLAGARTVLVSFMIDYHGVSSESAMVPQAVGALFFLGVLLALGVLYLVLAVYLVFSADVIAFTQHRREAGRPWVVVPVGLLIGGYCVLMLGAEVIVRHSLAGMQPAMDRVVQDDVQAMAARWDPDSIKTFLDARALEGWNDASREGFMNAIRPLGTYLGPGDEDSGVFLNANGIGTASFIRGERRETARCSEGRATFSFTLARSLFGPWQVVALNVGDIRFYDPPAHARAPAPSAPTASPATPAASATPAATPVPSTGG